MQTSNDRRTTAEVVWTREKDERRKICEVCMGGVSFYLTTQSRPKKTWNKTVVEILERRKLRLPLIRINEEAVQPIGNKGYRLYH